MVLYISGCEVIVGNFDVICYGKQVVNFEIICSLSYILFIVNFKEEETKEDKEMKIKISW
jgi:hypothetical protein